MTPENRHYIHKLKLKIQYLSQENKQLRAEITGQKKSFKNPVSGVIDFISKQTSVTTNEMLSRTRQRDIATARMLCMYIMRKHLSMQWTEIGRVFHRDHSTAIHACIVIENQLIFPKSFESQVIQSYEMQMDETYFDKNERIITEISKFTSITVEEIMGISRKKELIVARFGVFYALNKLNNVSYSDIGRMFNRNHSAIMHGIDAFKHDAQDSKSAEYQLFKHINTISV